MNVAAEVVGYDEPKVRAQVMDIYGIIDEIAERAEKAMAPTHRIADTIAQERLRQAAAR